MRLFASSGPIARLLNHTFKEGEVLAHPLLNKSIETAQKKVEQYYYSIRKRLLQYDDVLNRQREVIYSLRSDAIIPGNAKNVIFEIVGNEVTLRCDSLAVIGKENHKDDEEIIRFVDWCNRNFPINLSVDDVAQKSKHSIAKLVMSKIRGAYNIKQSTDDTNMLDIIERYVVIQAIDNNWQQHLTEMDALRNSVGLRGYGQRDPINEYRNEAFAYFDKMLRQVNTDVCARLFRASGSPQAFNRMIEAIQQNIQLTGGSIEGAEEDLSSKASSLNANKVSRNDLCPCGSGKKYKKCCGAKQ